MDISHAQHLAAPHVIASYAPVLWEPLAGSGERICAIVLLVPEPESSTLLAPAAHVVISARRLRAMLGFERGNSVHGILMHAALFMGKRLYAGADLSEALPPFKGFSVGQVRRVKGFTAKQVLDAAVRLVSAFGSAEELMDEADTPNNSTSTTREFLKRVQSAFSPAEDTRRQRFLRPVETSAGTIIIDYVYERHLVQFASAPTTQRQAQNMQREADAKILGTLTVHQSVMNRQGRPQLVVNIAPLQVGGLSDSVVTLANNSMAHYEQVAKFHGVETSYASSHDEAAGLLSALV